MKNFLHSYSQLIFFAVMVYFQPLGCFAQWSNSAYTNTVVCVEEGSQGGAIITPDGNGGAIIAWSDERNGYSDIYAQHFNADGVAQWAANGISICNADRHQYLHAIISDGTGGAIIAWVDFRNLNPQSNDPVVTIDIFAQRVNSNGVTQWESNGINISRPVGYLPRLVMVTDNNGGAIFSWTDDRHEVYAQGINANGTLKWQERVIATDVAGQAESSAIVSDGSGGAIITWSDYRNQSDQISASDIYAQRISADGTFLWGEEGVGIGTAPRFQNTPVLTADGNGGAIVAWLDDRDVSVDVYAQRINANGLGQWEANGIGICTTSQVQSRPTIATDQAGGAIIAWQNWTGFASTIALQRVSGNGTKLWMSDGVPMGSGGKELPVLTSNGNGGVILTWEDKRSSAKDIYAQHVDANGNEQWQFGGIIISNAYGEQVSPQLVMDNNSGAIITWSDSRVVPSNVYAQHVMANGQLGGANVLGNQTITFNSIPERKFSDAHFTLDAIASSNLPVTYTSSDLSVATIGGNMVVIQGVGTTTITANQSGNANFNAAPPASQQLTVSKGDQTITFNELPVKIPGDTPFTLHASSSSDLAISYASSNTAVATVSNNVVTIVGLGTTNITASQAGNANYNAAANVIQPFFVKASQSISFPPIGNKTLGDGIFTVSATSSAGLLVAYSSSSDKISISGNQVTILKAGNVTVKANQTGNATFAPAPEKTQTFCINPVPPSITISGSGTDSPILTSSSSTGNQWFRNNIAISGATSNTFTITSEGSYTVVATVDNCISEPSDEKVFTITGIEDQGILVKVYPNPMENNLTIDVTGLKSAIPVTLTIYDMLGHYVYSDKSSGVTNVNVTSYPSGVYVLKIQQGKRIITKKITK